MKNDSIATTLVIQIMPLVMREFHVKVDPQLFFSDSGYADSVIGLAGGATNERLRQYAIQLRDRLRALGAGPAGAARSVPLPPGTPEAPAPVPDRATASSPGPARGKYVKSLR